MRLVITKSCVWVKSCVLKTFRERAFDYGPHPVHFAKVLGCFGVSVESKCANTKLPFSSCLQRSHSAFHFRSSLCSAQAPSPFSNCLYGIFKSNFCLCQYFFFFAFIFFGFLLLPSKLSGIVNPLLEVASTL